MNPFLLCNLLFESFLQFEFSTTGTVGEKTHDTRDDESEKSDADDGEGEREDFHGRRGRDYVAETDGEGGDDHVVYSINVRVAFDFGEDEGGNSGVEEEDEGLHHEIALNKMKPSCY